MFVCFKFFTKIVSHLIGFGGVALSSNAVVLNSFRILAKIKMTVCSFAVISGSFVSALLLTAINGNGFIEVIDGFSPAFLRRKKIPPDRMVLGIGAVSLSNCLVQIFKRAVIIAFIIFAHAAVEKPTWPKLTFTPTLGRRNGEAVIFDRRFVFIVVEMIPGPVGTAKKKKLQF
jgi:hypothetical protein